MPMPQQEIIEFIPNAGQAKVLTSKKRFIFALAGQRGGKTQIGTFWAYMGMQTPNTNGFIAANTLDQLNQSVLQKFFENFPQLRRYWVKRDRMLILPNESKVFFRSMDNPELIKGLNLHWAWVDEADGLNLYSWEILRSRVATTGGKILATSSIYRRSWIHTEIYQKFIKDPNSEYDFITWKSSDNPSFPIEEFERLKTEMDPMDFAREYGGEFSFASGLVYGSILEYGVVPGYLNNSKPVALVFGLDFGVNDPNTISVLTYNDDGNVYIIDEFYRAGIGTQELNKELQSFVDRYGRPYSTYMDPAGGIARRSLISSANPVDADKHILDRIQLLRNLIYQKRLYVFEKCVNHRREFSQYAFDPRHPELPIDKYNHCMDAAGMALENSYDILYHRTQEKKKEEDLTSFWQGKKEAGLYKENGMLDNKRNKYLGEEDYWSEY